jgi:hypothetical protein
VAKRLPTLVVHREAVGEQRAPVLRPEGAVCAVKYLPAPDLTIFPTADKCHRIVVANDRWRGRTAKQRAARQEAVVEEQHPVKEWLAVIAAELDRCSEAMG